jgi:hypothetical protein
MAGEVSFQLTEADYVAASRDALWDRVSGRNAPITAIVWMITVPFAAVTAVIYALRPPSDPVGVALLPIMLAVPAIYGFARLAAYLATSRAARRIFRQNEALQRPFRYSGRAWGWVSRLPRVAAWSPGPTLVAGVPPGAASCSLLTNERSTSSHDARSAMGRWRT